VQCARARADGAARNACGGGGRGLAADPCLPARIHNGLMQFADTNAANLPARFYFTNPQ